MIGKITQVDSGEGEGGARTRGRSPTDGEGQEQGSSLTVESVAVAPVRGRAV
jgi:hypothetical protein